MQLHRDDNNNCCSVIKKLLIKNAILHKRYSFFTKQKVIVIDAEKFVVELPVLKKNVTTLAEA